MKILVIGDFHGSIPKINEEFDLVLCTGDLNNNDELVDWFFKHPGAVSYDELNRKDYIRLYSKVIKSQDKVLKWLNNLGKKVYLVWGNHDYPYEVLRSVKYIKPLSLNQRVKKYSNINLLVTKAVMFKGVQILGFSGYRGYKSRGDLFDKKWNNRLKRLFKQKKKGFCIFLAHEPPRGVLDKVGYEKSPLFAKHIGNQAFAEFVKKYGPNIMVCGHMHENQGVKRLGPTLVVNSGQARQGEYALLEVINDKVKIKLV